MSFVVGLLLLPRSVNALTSYSMQDNWSPSPRCRPLRRLSRPGHRVKRRRVVVERHGRRRTKAPRRARVRSLSASWSALRRVEGVIYVGH